jgi:hypothetical protein
MLMHIGADGPGSDDSGPDVPLLIICGIVIIVGLILLIKYLE